MLTTILPAKQTHFGEFFLGTQKRFQEMCPPKNLSFVEEICIFVIVCEKVRQVGPILVSLTGILCAPIEALNRNIMRSPKHIGKCVHRNSHSFFIDTYTVGILNTAFSLCSHRQYVEMAETIGQSMRSKHLDSFIICGSSLAGLLGRMHFHKNTFPPNVPIWDNCMCCGLRK